MGTVKMCLVFLLVLFSTGCISWTGDKPVYYQRVVDNNRKFVPGRPSRYTDPVMKHVMIGNPLNVPIDMVISCHDWSLGPEELITVTVKPQGEFAALIDSTIADQYSTACEVVSWNRTR